MPLSFRHVNFFGYGIYNDLKTRLPYYKSDFKDAWNYRVIPSTLSIFFSNLLPAIAFAQDMFDKTDNAYGVNEVLMSSAIAGVVFGLFSGQPLCIVGVTGPISIFSYTVYELMTPRGTPYFPFMCWVYLWSMVFHIFIAVGNYISFMRIISLYSCDIFGFFINMVYIQKGIQILSNQFNDVDLASGYASIMVALCMLICGVGSAILGTYLHYFKPWVRKVFTDYGVVASVIFFTGFIHFGGKLDDTTFARLPVTKSFQPTESGDRRPHGWFIHFWPGENIDVGDVFLAIPFAILLTFLFYFDHNVSSLMCQSKEYPLTKPAGFHWDFLLLGITTGVAGIIGIPPPNGLIPQAPLHTDSLVVYDKYGKKLSVVEQRLTNTLQGAMTFVMMTRPFLVLLGLVPQAVLSGLFFIMAVTGLHGNIVTNRIRYFFLDKEYIETDPTCPQVWKDIHALPNKKWFYVYTILEVIGGVGEFVITLTIAAVGFPGVLLALAFCAKWVWPLFIPREDLDRLDGDVADEFILKNFTVASEEKKRRKRIRMEDEENKYEGETEVGESTEDVVASSGS
ncbi:Bor1 protein [Candida orthopsilosis Co 90-125]|uniref:Bor1 protein n=1 Tax=Candida orthopsilosis (strain 90-125) TaxID=1136231 RepID=H8WZE3_CANO9|nr:Bor1 protein [Candida orthopsilosis Co 90-125]CCG21811.1 Bor1 protein [Candida orthopsilosis Co 90-125]